MIQLSLFPTGSKRLSRLVSQCVEEHQTPESIHYAGCVQPISELPPLDSTVEGKSTALITSLQQLDEKDKKKYQILLNENI
ncbi:hypothetical protein RRG08_040813 [Elysia crispata]|uniref:Uncharacterized protein n=1 Tax=Elysia crispata TaxID=231223 RepID=A0AAE0Z951_9GAST|nr:hypothetical protein RRG08_040813 [Elysia crispata]